MGLRRFMKKISDYFKKKSIFLWQELLFVLTFIFSIACAVKYGPQPAIKYGPVSSHNYYDNNIKIIMEQKCNSCHGEELIAKYGPPSSFNNAKNAPAGNYKTDTYENLFGNGSDNITNVIENDSTSLLIKKTQAGGSMADKLDSTEAQKIYDWIVKNGAK